MFITDFLKHIMLLFYSEHGLTLQHMAFGLLMVLLRSHAGGDGVAAL